MTKVGEVRLTTYNKEVYRVREICNGPYGTWIGCDNVIYRNYYESTIFWPESLFDTQSRVAPQALQELYGH